MLKILSICSGIRYGSEDGHCKSDGGVETPGSGNGQGSQSGVGIEGVEIPGLPIFISSVILNTPI